jgi:predicted phage baseplate assembly protein
MPFGGTVTADDFEFLAREVPGVGRVRCLQPRPDDSGAPAPNTVTLLVIPSLPKLEKDELVRHVSLHESLPGLSVVERQPAVKQLQAQMTLAPATKRRLEAHLDSRRLLTTRLDIHEPEYVWVMVTARVKVSEKAEPQRVRNDVLAALYRFLHPMDGGADGQGWPFGQPLTIDKVYALIQRVRGVEYATELQLFRIDMEHEQLLIPSQEVIPLPTNGVFASYHHGVRVD